MTIFEPSIQYQFKQSNFLKKTIQFREKPVQYFCEARYPLNEKPRKIQSIENLNRPLFLVTLYENVILILLKTIKSLAVKVF